MSAYLAIRKPLRRRAPLVLAIALVLSLLSAKITTAQNIDPTNNGSRYAFGENVGWINAKPLGDAGPGVLVGDHELGGWMWGENLGWISLTCKNTHSCDAVAYGVLNDGSGGLSGHAWAENVGWINFAPTASGATIDPSTGHWSGRAWGENVGWITFASDGQQPFRIESGWVCVPPPAVPSDVPRLLMNDQSGGTLLDWNLPAGATGFDVLRGDLGVLRSTGGDFSVATEACLDNDRATMAILDAGVPVAGHGDWFLVRAVNCGGSGTYNSQTPGQQGDREPEIAASVFACPED